MTNEEIKKIAQSYGESVANSFDYEMFADPDFKHRLKVKGEAWKAEQVLIWLSKDYCIVPKEKLDALQDEIHGEIMCAHDDDDWQSVTHYIFDVMPMSFNNLFGKDMFEEDKR